MVGRREFVGKSRSMVRCLASFLCAFAVCVSSAHAQLGPANVLVLYDSASSPDSVLVAEHYAGSSAVPGGVGGTLGTRPGVLTLDLATIPGAGGLATAQISQAQLASNYKVPIRNWLVANGLEQQVYVLVLTKGMPHRVLDTDNPTIGDNPAGSGAEFSAGDATFASVDSELVLMWMDLTAGEAGLGGDSFADGFIINPYHRLSEPILAFSRHWVTASNKLFSPIAGFERGMIWRSTTLPVPQRQFRPGDMMLVCRLDGPTVADVTASLDRAVGLVVDVGSAVIILDESNSNGIADPSPNSELDNSNGPTTFEDDYESTRDLLLADGRFESSNVRYDALSGGNNFFVGPRVDFGGGNVVNGPVVLLATYGRNHAGHPGDANVSGRFYPSSFNYAPGAVFNTIESYNGRAFGGLGSIVNQAQLSEFIAAGGTFGIGSVWEPFALTVGDNLYIARNFLLGSMTWAEAAYTALPTISWTYVVVGDPLARVVRTSEDLTGDGRISIDDLYAWHASPTDVNNDGMIDETDRALVEAAVRGQERGTMHGRQRR